MKKDLKKYEKMAVEIFFTKDQDITPLIEIGMNKTSAKDTMKCYSYLIKGEPFRRGIQQNVILALLNKLYENRDKERLNNVLIALDKHFEIRLNKYNEKNVGAREITNEYKHKVLHI
jgi:hypothetical protein